MVRNIDELKALEKVMKSLYFAQSFELVVLDSNIMTRKMLDNDFPSNTRDGLPIRQADVRTNGYAL